MENILYSKWKYPLALFLMLWAFCLPQIQAQTSWDGSVDISWYNTTDDLFEISTPEQLAGVARLVNNGTTEFNNKTIRLTGDIWLNVNNPTDTVFWKPIGGDSVATNEAGVNSRLKRFKGTFDGNYHTIYNMCIKTIYSQAGFFGCIDGATIKNTAFVNPYISAKGMIGAIAGWSKNGAGRPCYIKDCMVVNATIIGGTVNNVGGIQGAGYSNSAKTYVENCGVTGSITGLYLGGLGGNAQYTTFTNSYFAGTLSQAQYYGGLAANDGTNENSYTVISGGNEYAGSVKTAAYMQTGDFITDLRDSIYKMDCALNNGYPVLKWMQYGLAVVGETNICSGSSTTLTATCRDSYIWSTGATTASITVSPATTTTYTVTGTTNGNSITDSIVVNVLNNIMVSTSIDTSYDGTVHGTISHNNHQQTCGDNTAIPITITANPGWYITKIEANGAVVQSFSDKTTTSYTYSLDPSSSSRWTIKAYLDDEYTISLSTVLNDLGETEIPGETLGLITPWGDNGVILVHAGNDTTLNFKGTARYHIEDVIINGTSKGTINSYTFQSGIYEDYTVKVIFNENCHITTLPFIEGFSGHPAGSNAVFPDCWNRLGSQTTKYPYVSSSYSNGNANSLYFTGSGNNYAIVVTPPIDTILSVLRVSFDVRPGSTTAGILEIGVISDTSDYTTFQAVKSIAPFPSYNSFIPYTIYFDEYTGNERRIAIKFTHTANSNIYIDNIKIELIPDCIEVTNVKISDIGGTTALVSWDESAGTPDHYEVKWKISTEEQYTHSENTLEARYALRSLSPNTDYTVSIASSCNGTTSVPVIKTFKTGSQVTCVAPKMLHASNITLNSATLSWVEDGSATQYEIRYRHSGSKVWIEDNNVLTETYPVSGLLHSTKYEFQVRALCDNNTFTTWSEATFITECARIAELPFTEDFEAYPGGGTTNRLIPGCWQIYENNNMYKPYVYSLASYAHSGSRFLSFNTASSTTNTVILPEFDVDITTLRVEFWIRGSATSGLFTLGVMEDPTDYSSFTPMDTVRITAVNNYQKCSYSLENYTGTGKYIAFSWSGAGSSANYYLDDLYIDLNPDCELPTGLAIKATDVYSVDLEWNNNENVSEWMIEYGLSGFILGTGQTQTSADSMATVSLLEPNTSYDFYLRANCGTGNPSFPVAVSARTECKDIELSDLPYKESFDSYGTPGTSVFPICWSKKSTAGNFPYIATPNISAPGSLYFSAAANNYTYATTEKFDIPINGLQATFSMKSNVTDRGFVIGVMTDPLADTSFVPVDTVFGTTVDTWVQHTVYLNKYTEGNGQYIAFKIGNFGKSYNVNFDDLVISEIDACPKVDRIVASNIVDTSVTLSWRENGDATGWRIEYGPKDFTPGQGEGVVITVTEIPFILNTLPRDSTYDIYIQPDCADPTAWGRKVSIKTTKKAAALPYICDFEDDNENAEWTLLNGTQTNKWLIDTLSNNTENGRKALYISKDSLTLSYANEITYAWAYRTVNVPEAAYYEVSFDWLARGDINYDNLRAFLIKPFDLTAGVATGLPGNISLTGYSSGTPTGWIDLGGGLLKGITNGIWQSKNKEFYMEEPGNYMLVFFWRNNATTEYAPPAQIDNIIMRQLICEPVEDIAITANVNDAAATWAENNDALKWMVEYGPSGFTPGSGTKDYTDTNYYLMSTLSPNTLYDIHVYTVCKYDTAASNMTTFRTACAAITIADLPHMESFDTYDGTGQDHYPDCWKRKGNQTITYPYITGDHFASAEYSLYLYSEYDTTYAMGITEELDIPIDQLMVNFKLRSPYYHHGLEVGVIEDITDAGTFVAMDTVYPKRNGLFNAHTVFLNSYAGSGKHIAFRIAGASHFFYIDDVVIDTIPSCLPPQNVRGTEFSHNQIKIEWDDLLGADDWQIEYGTEGFAPGSIDGTIDYVSSTPEYSVTSFGDASRFDIYIRTICAAGDTSNRSVKYTFSVPCAPDTLPYIQGFDSTTSLPVCWNKFENDGNTTGYVSIATNSTALSSPNVLSIGTNANIADYGFARMNHFNIDSLKKLQISFMVKGVEIDGSEDKLIIGAVTDPDDVNTLEILDTIHNISTDNWTRHAYAFTGYEGNAKFIVIGTPGETNTPFNVIVDNIVVRLYDPADSCARPIQLDTMNVSHDSATIIWTIVGNTDKWEYAYKPSSATDYSSGNTILTNSITLNDLTPLTYYDFRIRTLCIDSESEWVTFSFTTTRHPADTCARPTGITVSDITDNSAKVSWDFVDDVRWKYAYKLTSATDYPTPTAVSTNSITLSDLAPESSYDVRVLAICTNGESAWMETTFITEDSTVLYTITATAGANGSIAPEGDTVVTAGSTPVFKFYPNEGYKVENIQVNGSAVTPDTIYTFPPVQADATIHVEFTTVGLTGFISDNLVTVYPNPVKKELNVKADILFESLEITNLTGQVIYTATVTETEFRINVSSYAPGTYFIRMKGNQGTVTKKFIKE